MAAIWRLFSDVICYFLMCEMAESCSHGAAENELRKSCEGADGSGAKCIIVLGMAGSGKTTFIRQLYSYLYGKGEKSYVMNLDPAVNEVPFPTNVDIRDTVKYKQVMKEYGLGPNGAIMTSLNLFSTKFDQVHFSFSKLYSRSHLCFMVLI